MLKERDRKQLIEGLAFMTSYLDNLTPDKKLKIAAYLCVVGGVFILALILITGFKYSDFRNDNFLIPALFITGLSCIIGWGLIKRHKWPHYLAISGSILLGGLLAIYIPVSLLVIFFPQA